VLAAPWHLVVPGDPRTLTGGFVYDRRVAEGLRAIGRPVEVHALPPGWPRPSPAAREAAATLLASLPEGALVIIDGLAFGVLADALAAQARRLRLVALVHHPLAQETGLEPAEAARFAVMEGAALAHARRVLVTSATTADGLGAYGVPADRCRVVPPGTDPAPPAIGSRRREIALLCVATLTPRKGHEILLEALARIHDLPWRLVCAGSPDHDPRTAARIREQAARPPLAGRVRFHGELPPEAVAALYHRADVFVLPSWHEGYGMVFAEALARGLPVVATRAGAIPEVVPPQAGVLVPPGDPLVLAAALGGVIADPARRRHLAAGARAAGRRLPTWEQVAGRFEAALVDLEDG
jgi:glycosyltransferase involved in cell wall biosynthesis